MALLGAELECFGEEATFMGELLWNWQSCVSSCH